MEKILGTIAIYAKMVVECFISKQKWNNCIKNSIDNLRLYIKDDKNEKVLLLFNDVFDKDLAKHISNKTYKNKTSGVIDDIKDWIELGFESSMDRLKTEIEFHPIIDKFIEFLLDEIKEKEPLFYVLFTFNQMIDNEAFIQSKIESIENELALIKNNKKLSLNISSIEDLEEELKKDFDCEPKITLDFFDFQDEELETSFENCVKDENLNNINVCGKYIRETFYVVLKLLSTNYKERVIIVNDKKSWELISTQFEKGTIFVNSFFGEDIRDIENYKNIKILGDIYRTKCNVIVKRRLMKNAIERLEKIGFSHSKAYELMHRCHNIFPIFCVQNYNGAPVTIQKWRNAIPSKKIRLTAILCNSWSEYCPGDKEVISKLSNVDYDDFKEKALPDSLLESPFVIEACSFSEQHHFKIASLEDSWTFFARDIDKESVIKFINVCKEVLYTIPNYYSNYVDSEYHIKNISSEQYSSVLRAGLLSSLAQLRKYKLDFAEYIDSFVNEFFDLVKTGDNVNYLFYATSILTSLVEISPRETMKALYSSKKKSTIFLPVFKRTNKNNYLEGHDYTHVLWALEKLLFIDDTKKDAILTLFDINRLNIEYPINNKPITSLDTAMCFLRDNCNIDYDDKKELLALFIDLDTESAWSLIFNLTKCINGCSFSPLLQPNIFPINYVENKQSYTFKQIFDLISQSLLLLCKNANDGKKWSMLIDDAVYFKVPGSIYKDVFEILRNKLNNFDDANKEIIQQSLLKSISDNRQYCNSSWALDEKFTSMHEKLLREIHFSNEEIKYNYCFTRLSDNIPLLHPVVYNKNIDDEISETEDRVKILFESVEREYIEKNLDPFINLTFLYNNPECKVVNSFLFKMLFLKYGSEDKNENINLGVKILKYMKNYDFLNQFSIYLSNNHLDIYFEIAYKIYLESKDNFLIYLSHIRFTNFDDAKFQMFSKLPDEVKDYFWSKCDNYFYNINDHAFLSYALNQLKKCKNTEKYLPALYEGGSTLKFSGADYYEYIKNLDISFYVARNYHSLYEAREITAKITSAYAETNDKEVCNNIAFMQMIFFENFKDLERNFLYEQLAVDPKFYATMMLYMYNNNKIEKPDIKAISYVYSKFHIWKFCPGIINDKFDPSIFNSWLSEFRTLLENNGQGSLYYNMLGKLFDHSILDDDGIKPLKPIRDFIESLKDEDFKDLKSSYICEYENDEGMHNVDAGEYHMKKSITAKKICNDLRKQGYTKTANIYFSLSENYKSESEKDRINAENE